MLRRFFSAKDGTLVIAQRPNAPMLVWAMAWLGARLFSGDTLGVVFELVATLSLSVWAILELVSGTSPFRRTLGLGVLLWVLYALL
jgi:hypothetical protein